MDEVFHVPQAQEFCRNFPRIYESEWDPMITTLPGTYISSATLVAGLGQGVATGTLGISISSLPQGDWCSTAMLRGTNLLFVPLTIVALHRCLEAVRGSGGGSSTNHGGSLWTEAWIISMFPLLFFFNFLYYTDPGSTFFVLMCYAEARSRAPLKAAGYGVVAVLFRQTNIVWVVFSAAVSLLALLDAISSALRRSAAANPELERAKVQSTGSSSKTYQNAGADAITANVANAAVVGEGNAKKDRSADDSADGHVDDRGLALEIVRYLKLVTSGNVWKPALLLLLPFLLVAAVFGCFVVLNGGIVVGDRTAHKAVVHLPQLLYFIGFSAVFAAPHLWLGPAKLSALATSLKAKLSTVAGWVQAAVVGVVLAGCVGKFTLAHKYLLADNRHFPFYLWRKLFMRHSLVKFALVPVYMLAAFQLARMLRKTQRPVWILGFTIACGLALVPAELLEFRYFLPPYLLLRAHLPTPSSTTLFVEAAIYVVVNAATVWLFLNKTFEWENHPGEEQRFMW